MKYIILSFYCITMCIQLSNAQLSFYNTLNDYFFCKGKYMFNNENYVGCINNLTLSNQHSQLNLMQEAEFLLLASNFYQKTLNNTNELTIFLENYPQSHHKNEIYFMIATTFFKKKDYRKAEIWFNKTDIDLLPIDKQKDYIYQMGIILLKKKNYDASNYFFSILNYQNDNKYKNASKYYLAYIAYKKEDYDNALKNFLQLKSHHIFGKNALYHAICIYFIKKKYVQVLLNEKIILKNLTDTESSVIIKKLIGISSYYANNYQKSIQYLEQIKKKSFQDNTIIGLSYFQLKNYNKAIEYFTKNHIPNNALGQNIYMYIGQSSLLIKENKNALHAFEIASKMNFNNTIKENAAYNYAMILYKNSVENFGEIIKIMENFINTYPNSIYLNMISNALINMYLTTQNYKTALSSITKLEFPDKKLLEIKQKIYYHLGKIDFKNQLYDSAIKNFNYTITSGDYAIEEKNLSIYLRGEAQYQKKNYILAEKDYQSYSKIDNKPLFLNSIINYNLGYCAFNQQNYKKAEQFFKLFINIEKNNKYILSDAYARLGDCNFNNRKFIEAKDFYNRAINNSPSTSDYALFQISCILGLQKKYQDKIDIIDNLIKKFPTSNYICKAIYEKGHSYTLLNNKIDAIKTYQILLYQYPESDLARIAGIKLGLLYYNSDQFQKAIEIYKYIVSNYPKSDEAKEAIKDLKLIYFTTNDITSYYEYVKSLGEIEKFKISEQDSLTHLEIINLLEKGETKKIQNALTNYIKLFPNGQFCSNVHYYLANIYYEQKEYDLAKKEYDEVLIIKNSQFVQDATEKIAKIQYNNEKYEESLQLYKKLEHIAKDKINQYNGILGILRSSVKLNKHEDIITYANLLLQNNYTITPEIITEVKYYRTKSYLALKKYKQAELDLNDLSINTQTTYGAEARYLLAKFYFDKKDYTKSKNIIQDYIKQGTIHNYWLARSIILLSDIHSLNNDMIKSRQYLESLKMNYKNINDDIHSIIEKQLIKF